MAALLTGVGYIGAPLVRRLVDNGEHVVAFDNFSSTPRSDIVAALPTDVPLVEGDLAEPVDVARAFDRLPRGNRSNAPLTVFHMAAQPSAAIAARDPQQTERSNLVGARVLLEAAHERGAQVVFGGSFRVYGDELGERAVDEDTPYGRVGDLSHLSKIYVEQLARMIGGAFVSVRLGVTYGRSPIMKHDPSYMTVPNLFCQRAVAGDVLNVLEDRPLAFIHVDDAVEALLAAVQLASPSAPWQALNAAPEVATIGQLARTVQRRAQVKGRWVRIHGVASTPVPLFSVSSRLENTGFAPRVTLNQGLDDVLAYFAARERAAARTGSGSGGSY